MGSHFGSKRFAVRVISLVLAMVPGITRWNATEKQLAARVISAKARGNEALYLRLMQGHAWMRAALIGFGS